MHGILPAEQAEILALYEEWGEVDRSHRKLAHGGSYLGRVWVSPSIVPHVLAVADKHFRPLPRPPRTARQPFPRAEYRPNSILIYDTILLAVSDNGPQMISGSTREFLAMCAIAQRFGRPGTPTDQAWIESLNGHLKYEYPHLLAIANAATLPAELAVVRRHYNSVRLHAGIGYVTPDDEHEGRGAAIRKAPEAGFEAARLNRPRNLAE